MKNSLNTEYTARFWERRKTRKQINQIAKDMGFNKSSEIDAFRHAYASAKFREAFWGLDEPALLLGHLNELRPDNEESSKQKDIINNRIGREIYAEVNSNSENLDPTQIEIMLRNSIKKAILEKRLITNETADEIKQRYNSIDKEDTQGVKDATADTLRQMHQLVAEEKRKQERPNDIVGAPLPSTDKALEEAINRTLGNAKNAEGFAKVARQIARVLNTFDDANPTATTVTKVLEALKNGDIKIDGSINMPDILPQAAQVPTLEETLAGKTNTTRTLNIGGVAVTVRPSGGQVPVRAHTRDGSKVKAHQRTAPDGNPDNNLR